MKSSTLTTLTLMVCLSSFPFASLHAQSNSATPKTTSIKSAQQVDQRAMDEVVQRGIAYLSTKGQAEDGSFSAELGPGITALVVTSLIKSGRTPQDPVVAKGLKYLESFVRPDGGIHEEETLYRNYETCLSMLCFVEANQGGRYDLTIDRADAFVKGIQWDENENKEPTDFDYGGAGYGKHQRPDMSNTTFLVEALRAAGNDADSEAIQRALIFISRAQNFESPHNTTPFAAKNPDGGFFYTPAAGGQSQAGETPDGGLRSYGSMTYAGLKSMIYAGVTSDDARVKAAVTWIQKHYDLKTNPGMGAQGLFYYYHTFAKALDAVGQESFADADGVEHAWRVELFNELAKRQLKDGSWLNNDADRWLEGDTNLVTGYALMALAYCQKKD